MLLYTQVQFDLNTSLYKLPSFFVFLFFCLLSISVGNSIPLVLKLVFKLIDRRRKRSLYNLFIQPIQGSIKVCTILLLVHWSAKTWLIHYQVLSGFLEIVTSLVFFGSIAWITSRVLGQFIRVYGIRILRHSGLNVNEILLVFEAIANIIIGFIAVILFAESRDFPWIGIFAGASLAGVTIGLAVSKTAEDFLSTLLLYLDNRFLPGDYIRLPAMEGRTEEVFGRVESIGWRSTTIRIAGKNTIYITTNTMLVQQEIENVSRGKRIMVLLTLNFSKTLENREQALIEEIVLECTEKVYGIASNSTKVKFAHAPRVDGTNAIINFAILGSSETSVKLRKDILESACEEMAAKLKTFGITFITQEPLIYIESPVTL